MMSPELNWITTRPTEPGYYWFLGYFIAPRSSTPPYYIDGDRPIVCHVIDNPLKPGCLIVLVAGDESMPWDVNDAEGRWTGPLTPPEE
jgi:hypothetical protein